MGEWNKMKYKMILFNLSHYYFTFLMGEYIVSSEKRIIFSSKIHPWSMHKQDKN